MTIETASLWASGDGSIFAGSGGPQAYDPFFGQFADVVTSAGLDSQPFNDQLWNVGAGDEVVFVIAVQNRGSTPAYGVTLRDLMPAGFAAPPDADGGTQLSVMDGSGNALDFTGDLFSAAGVQLAGPVAAYDPNTGDNVVLVTFSLIATTAVQAPLASLSTTAEILSYAGAENGANLAAAPITASTPVTTGGIAVASAADQTITSLGSGQTASFDVTLTLPEGTTRDLRIDEILPQSGNSWLHLVSAQVISVGANLQTAAAPVIGTDGSIAFGTVVDTPDNVQTGADQIVVRVSVQGAGTAAGQGILQTQVSAADPNVAGQRWTDTLTNTLALQAPDVAPTIAGTSGDQNATSTMQIRPFAAIAFTDPDPGQTETVTIHLSDPLLGRLSGNGLSTAPNGDYVLSGSVAQVQASARNLVFATGPGRSGLETMTVTIDDGAGGRATDATTAITVSSAAPAAASIQHFPLAATGSVLTSTADGSQTVAQVETYQGPVDYLQSQFIYDGTAPLAIVADTPNIFIKNVAGSTAIQLLSGQNVVDAGHGSNFLVGGTGTDVFFLDARQPVETWDTIVGFKPGDIATLWGFKDGTSQYSWDDNAGVGSFTGRTLRADLTGSGHVDASITFAGTTAADTARYAVTTGSIGGNDYMTIFSL
ncbi:MAG: DUF11 domain-containing protein [Acetobacteraceae bacterium]|nr:DUF11 domain-containing protein [Acetobacteraceae bacterium]